MLTPSTIVTNLLCLFFAAFQSMLRILLLRISSDIVCYSSNPPTYILFIYEAKAIVPTSNLETVFDIKYSSHNQRCNHPPIRCTVVKKDDIVKEMKEKSFDVADFTMVYLTTAAKEDYNACVGGYCK
ncbi:unnamed protein product [Lactuca saligna]|uniref:Uncharacterized protein n=1 Tax=Lactuca saligna TaxID=75948 RepID=A0AA35ZNA7_LACSI|nr:unnamed protein product [Lactuca saligna]